MLTTLVVQEAQFFEAVHDPGRGAGRLETVRNGDLYRVELDREFGMLYVKPLLQGEPHPEYPEVWVPIQNVRSMRIARRDLTTTLAHPAPSKKSA